MVDERLRRIMQEELDGNLEPEIHQFLQQQLEENEEARQHYNGLRQVDALFSAAPFERAPLRLAVKIMERVAQQVKAQPQTDLAEMIVSLSLAVVTLAAMPILVAASWLVLNAMADPSLLINIIEQIIVLLTMVIKAIEVLLVEVEQLAQTDPETAKQAVMLIPLTLLGFINYLEENFNTNPIV